MAESFEVRHGDCIELAKHGAKSVRAKVQELREDCAQTNQLAMF